MWEAVEDMQRLGAVFADELSDGGSHMSEREKYDFETYVLAQSGEESSKRIR